jgi:hypothetical protein
VSRQHAPGDTDLSHIKKACADLAAGGFACIEGEINLACWLGERAHRLVAEVERARAERDKLQRFKDYVHARLDAAGVTVDPESTHKAEGCRIGGRLDEVFAVRAELLAAATALWADRDAAPTDQEACRRLYNAWRAMGESLVKSKGGAK